MKILVVGGGSGGHITPAVAVVREILKLKPRTKVEFWTDRKYYKNVVKITTEIGMKWGKEVEEGMTGAGFLRVRKISAGKFRRYSGWKFWDYFENFEITWRELIVGNLVGFCGFVVGILQSFWRLLKKEQRPDVVFLKGGFVGLPVGLVARLFKIPIVLHESDAAMGLANRILEKYAAVVAIGQDFDEERVRKGARWEWVGIPVAEGFKSVSSARQKNLKKTFGFEAEKPLVVVTGGSQGAVHLNNAMREILPEMLKFTSVAMIAGRKNYQDNLDLKKYEVWERAKLQSNFRLWEFNSAMYELLGAADVVISRAGATTIAELATLARPAVILVPFEKLPNGHQVKNARKMFEAGAVEMIVDEDMMKKPEDLLELTRKLVKNEKKRALMTEKMREMVKPKAAKRLAEILLEVVQK